MTQLTLTAPDPVAAIPVEQAAGLVHKINEVRIELQGKVNAFVAELLKHDSQSPEFEKITGQISSIGQNEIVALSSASSRFLDKPTKAMGQEGGVGRPLPDLLSVVDGLAPGPERGPLQAVA